jgi:RecB family endonuclease NucS
MDAILFSFARGQAGVDDAIRHLQRHTKLYWDMPVPIKAGKLSFPIQGFIHIKGGQVEYEATIVCIIPYSRAHYEDPVLSEKVKPKPWRCAWQNNLKNQRAHNGKCTLIITKIEPFSIPATALKKVDGTPVKRAPMGFTRILPPTPEDAAASWLPPKTVIPEKHLEAVVLHNLGKIEPGLTLVKSQVETPAGRIDLLCKDVAGKSVVIELKKSQGTDRVVGQILRYMGYLIEKEGSDNVRGIIVVQTKDQRLTYAVNAARNIQVREFKIDFAS